MAVLGGTLWLAPHAFAVSAPRDLTVDPLGPSFGPVTREFSWLPPSESGGGPITYLWTFTGGLSDTQAGTSVTLPGISSGTFSVRALEDGGEPPESDPVEISVSAGASIAAARSPSTGNAFGWNNTAVTVSFSCAFVVSCPGSVEVGTSSASPQSVTRSATSLGGDSGSATVSGILVDRDAPSVVLTDTPRAGQIVGNRRPVFTWTPSSDAHSGVDRYEVLVGGEVVATSPAGPTPSAQPAGDLPIGGISWRVRTVDRAGNTSLSAISAFTVDPSVTPAPGNVSGPPPNTSDPTPSFTWTGLGPRFRWVVTPAGDPNPVRQGETEEKRVRIGPALPDGAYVFRVAQAHVGGQYGEEASYPFTVDTIAPGAPTITGRPPASSALASPQFSWQGEPGGTYLWRVVNDSGIVERGPIAVNATQVSVGPLGPGTYLFQVRQRDAAGNLGPWSGPERFTVTVAGGSTASSGPIKLTPRRAGPPRPIVQNARRLKPRVGVRIPTLRPVLQWQRGPRFTTLYNVQVFEIRGRRVVKVRSAFSRNTQWRVPPRTLKKGTRYAWRVWPYRGLRGYTKKPLGISYFDVSTKLKQPKARAARR